MYAPCPLSLRWSVCCGCDADADVSLADDMVIHLVTAAIGAPSFYEVPTAAVPTPRCAGAHPCAMRVALQFGKEAVSNPSRFHDCAAAADADRRTLQAWDAHPNRIVVDNSTDFGTKVHRVLAPICQAVGLPAPKLLTRVVLVHDLPIESVPVHVEQFDVTIIAIPTQQGQPTTSQPAATNSATHLTRSDSTSSTVGPPRVSLIRRLHGGSFAYTRREQHVVRVRSKSASVGEEAAVGAGDAGDAGGGDAEAAGLGSPDGLEHHPDHVTVTKQRPIVEREYMDTIHSHDVGMPVDERVWCFHVNKRFYTLKKFGHMASLGVLKLEVEVR